MAALAGHLIPAGSMFAFLAEHRGEVFPDGDYADLFAPAASSLVAAFNGGFKMKDAHGGYYTEGRMIDPLVRGAASLVIYANGSVTVGAWGGDVAMTPSVVAVRQNLLPLVVNGRPSATTLSASRHDPARVWVTRGVQALPVTSPQ